MELENEKSKLTFIANQVFIFKVYFSFSTPQVVNENDWEELSTE